MGFEYIPGYEPDFEKARQKAYEYYYSILDKFDHEANLLPKRVIQIVVDKYLADADIATGTKEGLKKQGNLRQFK
jgi:hypothetical protein